MMYLSEDDESDYTLAIQLDEGFLRELKRIMSRLEESLLDISLVQLNFDKTNARLIEKYTRPYTFDKSLTGDNPLDYYGFDVNKNYFPTEDYWDENSPDKVFLEIYCNTIGFSFHKDDRKYQGHAFSLSDWGSFLS